MRIDHHLIGQLHCPYCDSGFRVEQHAPEGQGPISYGIIACACYRYPIIEGILILRQTSGPTNTNDDAVVLLESGDKGAALRYVLEHSPVAPNRTGSQWLIDALKRRLRRLARGEADQVEKLLLSPARTLREAISVLRPRSYGNYLLHRYANNSFLAAIPLLMLAKELRGARPTVLDVNCGVGHASFVLQTAFPDLSVIATDHDFVNLYLARRYLIPNAACICMDAEAPLPFADALFDAAVCMDGLHYVRAKRALLRELDRTITHEGLWLFPHMHNARGTNFSPGVPLTADDYMRLFEFVPSRLLSESEVFTRFMHEQALELGDPVDESILQMSDVFSLVASRRADLWGRQTDLAAPLVRAKVPLRVNPIYQPTRNHETVRLDMSWPAGNLERECEAVKQFLPQSCSIAAGLWDRLHNGAVTKSDEPEIEKLRKSFVLVPLPEAYA
jgi:SAM-dependent methyltransferase